MPEVPTPGVNGQVTSLRLLHASRSISSLAPAAAMLGSIGFTATAGSFCLFCGNGVDGLPTVTSVSEPFGVAAATPTTSASAPSAAAIVARNLFMLSPSLDEAPILDVLPRKRGISRGAGEVDEVSEGWVCLAHVPVAERRMDVPAGRVEVDGRQAEAPLDRPLHPAQALHLGERNPVGRAPDAAGGGDDAGVRPSPGEVVV